MNGGKGERPSELPGVQGSTPLPALLAQVLSILPLSFTGPQILSGVKEEPSEVIRRAREEADWTLNVKIGKYSLTLSRTRSHRAQTGDMPSAAGSSLDRGRLRNTSLQHTRGGFEANTT